MALSILQTIFYLKHNFDNQNLKEFNCIIYNYDRQYRLIIG